MTRYSGVNRRRGVGEGNLGCLVWILVIGALGLVLFKFVPVKVHTAQLKDFASEQAQFAGRRDTADSIKKQILKKAKELDLEVDPKAIKVTRGQEAIRIEMRFTIPLEFPGYTYEYVVDETIEKQIFNF